MTRPTSPREAPEGGRITQQARGEVDPTVTVFAADEQHDVDVDLAHLRRLADFVLTDRGVPGAMETSILCVDTDTITRLNGHHMGVEGPTDVLAFPIDAPGEVEPDQPALLGDVVLCPAVAAANADRRDLPVTEELELLVVHGLLHLLGHDHGEPAERATMFALTDELLSAFRGVLVTGASEAAELAGPSTVLGDGPPAEEERA